MFGNGGIGPRQMWGFQVFQVVRFSGFQVIQKTLGAQSGCEDGKAGVEFEIECGQGERLNSVGEPLQRAGWNKPNLYEKPVGRSPYNGGLKFDERSSEADGRFGHDDDTGGIDGPLGDRSGGFQIQSRKATGHKD